MLLRKLILITTFLSSPALSITVVAQDLGHKLPGLIGLDAGRIPEPGLYLVDRLVNYSADELRDRNGNVIPVGDLKLQGLSNAIGISYTMQFPQRSLTLTSIVAAPLARLRLNVNDRPEANFDRFGLADIYIQPARLGWSSDYFDAVGSYAVYLPTGTSPLAGGTGVSQGQVTHEFSLGGSIYANNNKDVFVTTLASYDHNLRKRDVDIIRGDTFRIQGGVGVSRFKRMVEAGIAGYGLWQVGADRGADLPPLLRGLHDQAYGVGPEAAVFINAINAQIRVRFEWDLTVQSRPKGNVFSAGINFVTWQPKRPAAGP
jgi:hypothetical protein